MILDSPAAKFEVIRKTLLREDNLLNVKSLCEIAGVSRSGYYQWLKAEAYRNNLEEQDRSSHRHNLYSLQWSILLSFNDFGCIYKTGSVLCFK